jgi:hypothetical protein
MVFPSNNPKNALRQARVQKKWLNLPIAPKQHKPRQATSSAFLHHIYFGKHAGMVGGEGLEPPTYSV